MNQISIRKAALIVMDGWGLYPDTTVNAIASAHTPFVDSLFQEYPNTSLVTYGEEVGLPHGQMGNSEVGHMNLGAGRIVYQELLKINNAIQSGAFFEEEVLKETFEVAANEDKKLHLMGLVSDGGVHSHIEHLKALIDMAEQSGVNKCFVHIFTDGRDCDPKSGLGFVREIDAHCKEKDAQIATITGRYFAMDRDKRWPRIKKAYDALVNGKGSGFEDAVQAVQASYDNGVTDEFIEPIILKEYGQPMTTIEDGDTVLCFNFRTDRCRQITQVLTQEDMPQEGMKTMDVTYVTMTNYDESFRGVKVVYDKETLKDTIGEVVSSKGLTQLRIAETEKYPHVTFFFSGGQEESYEGESRIVINSPKVATYDLQPEMSAYEVRDAVVKHICEKEPHFVCLNYANTDMVGHTGDFNAAQKAAEAVDACVRDTVTTMLDKGYTIFLTADHGNADHMVNEDGSPNTAHSKNPVPLFVIGNDHITSVRPGKLADLAPSILTVMGIEVPELMTGNILIDLP